MLGIIGTNRLTAVLIVLVLLASVPVTFAQMVSDDDVNDVASGLFCPVCESEPLDTCGTQACQDWRDEIRVQLEDGRTKAQIYDDFQARYGDKVLAEPPAAGFNLALWLTIPIALLIGGVLFFRYINRIKTTDIAPNRPSTPPPSPRPTSAATSTNNSYIDRIEEELRNE